MILKKYLKQVRLLSFFNIKTRKTVIVPFHQGKELPIGTLKAIEKQSELDFV
jgi:predicted RNA binding protein YcfA (HicA-like mRNA interferase family)